jgi:MSHA biogenesis protein MshQ
MMKVRRSVLSVLALFAGCAFDTSGAGVGGSSDAASTADAPPVTDAPTIDARGIDASGIDASAIDAPASNARRKAISIDNTKVTGTQTDFPVWFDVNDADIAARAQSDGRDIYFTAADGTTRLDYEIQYWNASAHHLMAWIRIPTLDASAPTVFYINYGDPAAVPVPNPPGVFRSSFVAVWHLDDTTLTSPIKDATGTHLGTPTLPNTTRVNAKLGSGFSFTDSTDTITFTNPLTGTSPHTISVWVNQPAVTHPSTVLVVGSPNGGQSRFFYTHFTGPALAVGYYNLDWTTTTNLDNTGWTLLHWVFDGATGTNHLYRNGVEIAGSPQTLTGINTMGTTGIIGHAPEPAYGTNMGLQGTIDELRIATVARSAGWVATEYANQSSPSTFYTVGPEQSAP